MKCVTLSVIAKVKTKKIFPIEKVSVTTFRTEIQQTNKQTNKKRSNAKHVNQICYLRTDIEQRYCSTVTAQVTYL